MIEIMLMWIASLFLSPEPVSWSENDLQCLATNVYYESRGEPTIEQISVAYVTLNRADDPRFPASICEVVHQPYQFSWTLKPPVRPLNPTAMQKAEEIALMVLENEVEDPTKGATHFYAPKLLKNPPKWTKRGYDVVELHSHTYMKVN